MVFRQSRQVPGSRKAIVYAVLVHLMLVALLVVGVRWRAQLPAPAPVIQARVMNEADTRREQEQRRRAEQERAATVRQQHEQEQRRQEQARVAEQKRKVEAEKRRQAQEKHAAEARAKKETEERRKAAETNLKEQLAREEKERAAAAAHAEQSARAQSELDRYQGLISQKVNRNWVRPAGWSAGMEVVVRVRLAPTGEVIQVTIVRPSGNVGFDRSVENAVYKASPLPLPEDKGLFEHFRELEFRFKPEGQG